MTLESRSENGKRLFYNNECFVGLREIQIIPVDRPKSSNTGLLSNNTLNTTKNYGALDYRFNAERDSVKVAPVTDDILQCVFGFLSVSRNAGKSYLDHRLIHLILFDVLHKSVRFLEEQRVQSLLRKSINSIRPTWKFSVMTGLNALPKQLTSYAIW